MKFGLGIGMNYILGFYVLFFENGFFELLLFIYSFIIISSYFFPHFIFLFFAFYLFIYFFLEITTKVKLLPVVVTRFPDASFFVTLKSKGTLTVAMGIADTTH